MRVRGITLSLLAVLGCRPEQPPLAGQAPSVDPATTAGRVTLELWQPRAGITLGAWASANLNDQITGPDSVVSLGWPWCARGVSIAEVGGRPLQRQAFFVLPEPPTGLALPDTGGPDLVLDCTLAALRIDAAADDSAHAHALLDSIASQLAAAFGARSADSARVPGWAFWRRVERFERRGVTALVAWQPAPNRAASSGGRVVAMAYLRDSTGQGRFGADAGYGPVDSIPLDSAVRLARLDTTLWGGSPPLVRWIEAAAELPPARRAAALYAADLVLERSLCSFVACDDPAGAALRPLRAAGATFTWSPLGATWNSNRAWLGLARAAERDSPLGQRILLAQMGRGFDFSGTCARGAEGFRSVIANGERYLERVPRSPIIAEVHFLMAEAYLDIIALAGGAGDVYADASLYQEEAAEALSMAQTHYRAAIAADRQAPVARAAWRQAWKLMAGLPPSQTRFFCVYD